MSKFNLRDSIKKDYQIDLPISGGIGLSQDDPIIIETEDALHAPNIEWRVIDCINRSFERAWLISNKEIFQDGDKLIEKISTNVNYLKDGKPYRVVTYFYFDITAVKFQTIPTYTYFPTVYVDPKSEIAIPFQISWLNFRDFVDNEKDSVGNGLSFFYGCPSIKSTLYIYNNTIPKIELKEDLNLILDEFEESASQIKGEEIKSKLLDSIESENFLKRAFKVEGNDSFILLTAVNNYFVKFRLTKQDNVFSDEMTKHIIEQLVVFVRLYQNKISLN